MADTDLTTWERRLLRVIDDVAPREHKKLLRKAGNLMRKHVRRATPRVEGELRKSYRVKVKYRDNTATVYTNKFYAKMVEEGHANVKYVTIDGRRVRRDHGFTPGKFYFKKGFEDAEEELPELLKDFIGDLAREMGLSVTG